jgi:sugar lactone lactonase YvrE
MRWLWRGNQSWSLLGGFGRVVLAGLVGVVGVLMWSALAGGTQPYETYESTVASDGPVAQYRFDDAVGSSTIADSAGSYTASNSGITLGGEGPFGGSKSGAFGGEAFATLPADPLAGASAFTAEAWVDWAGATLYKQPVFDFGSSSTNYMYLTPASALSGHTMLFEIHTSAGTVFQVTATKPKANAWEYLAVSETSTGTLTLYLNGEQVGQTTGATISPTSLGSTPSDYLGRALLSGEPMFKGSMSNVAFYNKALSASQILAHYNAGEYPVNTVLPTISGTAKDDKTLTAKAGTWTGLAPITFAYQWTRCNASGTECTSIGSATETKYTLGHEDVGRTLRVAVSASNGAGTGSATSAQTAVVAAIKPSNTALPVISGTPNVGQLLSVSNGSWEGSPVTSYTYQWQACNNLGAKCKEIAGATASTYRVIPYEIADTLRAIVTAANSGGSASATSGLTGLVGFGVPVNTALPATSGTPRDGQTLTASSGSWAGTEPITYAYQWQSCNSAGEGCSNISGATSSSYTLGPSNVGSTLDVIVTAKNAIGSTNATSPITGVVAAIPPSNTAAPAITGTARDGQTLTASTGTWTGTPPISYAYQWQSCNSVGKGCANVAGATDSTYLLGHGDVGSTLRVVVTASNAGGSASSTSAATAVVAALAPSNTAAPAITGTARDGQTLTASTGTWTGTPPLSYAYQWQSCNGAGESCSNISGATSSTYLLGHGDVGSTLRVVVTASNAGGSAAGTSAATGVVAALAPSNTVAPVISGSAQEGQTLSASTGTWEGTPPISYSYQWESCNGLGEGCLDVAGATGSSYALGLSDVGTTLRVLVTASNAGGSASSASEATAIVSAGSASGVVYSSQFGSEGSGEGQFEHPGDVAVDSKGDLWVADVGNDRIEEFNESGEYLSRFGSEGSGGGQFNAPSGVAVSPTGDVWVVDTGNNRIEEFNRSGEYLRTVGSRGSRAGRFEFPEGIAVDAHGDVWVSDTAHGRVEEFNENGEYLKMVGSRGSGAGEIGEPEGLAIDSKGNVWVADWSNNRVEEFNEKGEYIREFGTSGSSEGQFEHPYGIAVDSLGDVWVGDVGNNRVEEFNEEGEYVSQFGSQGSGAGEFKFSHPMGLAAVLKGNVDIWVADPGNDRVEKWTLVIVPPANTTSPGISGEFVEGGTLSASTGVWTGTSPISYSYQWQSCDESGGECADISGATGSSYAVGHADVGKTLRVLVTASNVAGSATAASQPTRVISLPNPPANTALPVISGRAYNEQTLSASTGSWEGTPPISYSYQWQHCNAGPIGARGLGPGQLLEPEGIAVDSHGDVWVMDTKNNRVEEFNEKGEYITQFGSQGTSPGQFEYPRGIAVDSKGDIWVADFENERIEEFTETGEEIDQFPILPFGAPEGIVVDSNGDVWVTLITGVVQEYSEGGALIREFGLRGSGEGQLEGFNDELALAANGDVWVVDRGNGRLEEFGPDGEYIRAVGSEGSGDGQFGEPQGIAINAEGEILVTDAINHRVEEFSGEGAYLGQFSLRAAGASEDTQALTVAPNGDILVLDDVNGDVLEFDEHGEYIKNEACVDVPGARSEAYSLGLEDVGFTMRVLVRASDVLGSASAASAVSAVVSPLVIPANTAPPVVSGIAEDGETLSASEGSWTGSPPRASSYQWQRCNESASECEDIPYALNPTYVLSTGDVGKRVRVLVTRENPEGSATAASELSSPVAPAARPANTAPPSISGSARDGQTLSASAGSWTGSPPISYAYQWQLCNAQGEACAAIEGASSSEYQLTSSDIAATVRVLVTATNSVGSAQASSAASAQIEAGPPREREAPTVAGTLRPGQTLTATSGSWAGTAPISYAYQWQQCTGGTLGPDGSDGEPATNSPQAVTVDSKGDVWVVDIENDRVEEFNAHGEYLRTLTEGFDAAPFSFPDGIAANSKGDVWVSDEGSDSVEEFDEDGVPIRQFGSEGAGDGQFDGPAALAVDSKGNVWVVDFGNRRVEEFNESGAYIRQFGSEGSGKGQFSYPQGIAVDSSGDVWVADGNNDRVEEFNQRGEYVAQFGSEGSGEGQFGSPQGLAVDAQGDVWVADAANHRVEEFNQRGEYLAQIALEGVEDQFSGPYGIAFASDGDLWVTNDGKLAELTPAGGQVTSATWGKCTAIEGATGPEYTLSESDVGLAVRVVVSATNTLGSAQASSAASAVVEPGAPGELEAPSISGTPQDGQTLKANTGSWSAAGPVSYAYQWESCNAGGSECAPIEDATGSEYELGEGDIASTLRVVLTATGSVGSTQATSPASAVVGAEPPVELEAPSISGTPSVHEVLYADPGVWTGTATDISYQWESCDASGSECAPIEDATGSEYELGEGDVATTLRVRVGAHSAIDSLTDVSSATPVIGGDSVLVNTTAPSISGTPESGQTLTAQPGGWSQSTGVSFAYQWQSCDRLGSHCQDIEGATSSAYTLGTAEVGEALHVLVSASSETQSASQVSPATQPVAATGAPVVREAPQVSGTTLVGQTLSAGSGAWSREGPISYTYQWERCDQGACQPIEGAHESSYTLTEGDAGSTLLVVVSATDAAGSATGVSSATAITEPEPIVKLSGPSISGVVQIGGTLNAEPGIWSGSGPLSYAYQWETCNPAGSECTPIEGATEPSYLLPSGDLGSSLRVRVTVGGLFGSANALSPATAVTTRGHASVEETLETAQRTDPALIAPSTSATLEEQTVAPALRDGEEGLSSTGTLTSSMISKETPGELSLNTPAGQLSFTPLESSPEATKIPTIVNGAAALFANTWPATDTIMRPDALGATTLLQLRSAEAPTSFSWEARIGPDQKLQQLPNGAIALTSTPQEEPTSEPETTEPEASGEPPTTTEGPPESSAEQAEREEDEAHSNEAAPLEHLPAAPTASTPPTEAPPGEPQPQNTQAEYENARSLLATAEAQSGASTLLVIQSPTATDAAGHSVPASLSVTGDTIKLTLRPTPTTTYPVLVDPTFTAPPNKASEARVPAFRYGFSDLRPETFMHSGPAPEEFNGFDPHLTNGPLHIKTVRLVIPYDTLVGKTEHREQEELHAHKREKTEKERLIQWLQAVKKDRLEPFITFKSDTHVAHECEEGHVKECKPPSLPQYRTAVHSLMAYLINGNHKKGLPAVRVWGAWNEPDLHGNNPLPNDPERAAQFWQVAQNVLTSGLHCSYPACTMVAGEFAEYDHTYIESYRSTLYQHPCKECWSGKPHIWGLHDYHDVTRIAEGSENNDAKEFTKLATERLADPRIWISEAGVELQNNSGATGLEGFTSIETDAAEDFLRLHSVAQQQIERVYYYQYKAPTEAENQRAKGHAFDSALLNKKNEPRPAYCVLAFDSSTCPPAVKTGPSLKTIGGLTTINNENACTMKDVKVTLSGTLNPNGSPTTYYFEYGQTPTKYEHSTPTFSAGEGHGVVAVSAPAELETIGQGTGKNCKTLYYRLAASNATGKSSDGDASEVVFDTALT